MVVDDVIKLFGKVDGEIILDHYFKLNKLDIFLNRNKALSKEEESIIKKIYEQYKNDYPLQYTLGQWNFYGRDFLVEEGVLIPRFETEILIEKLLELKVKFTDILEIGVGTGIISLTLAMELKGSKIMGIDISEQAIRLANMNKEKYDIKNVEFFKSNLFENVENTTKFDLIVSNPPYINKEDMGKLDRKLDYEPENALYGGEDGLYFYRKIIEESKDYLTENGYLAFEIGYDQGEYLKEYLKINGFENIRLYKDYNGFDRCIIARR